MSTQVRIQVLFTENTPVGQYTDAIYFTEAEYAAKSPSDIEALKQIRIDNWVRRINNPPIKKEPTKEELQLQADALQNELNQINEKISGK